MRRETRRVISEIATALGDLALPRCCVACGRPLHLRERYICLECLSDLPLTHFWQYRHNGMARHFNERLNEVIPDGIFVPFATSAALFFYNSESPYRQIPQALKYRSSIRMGRHFARMLGAALASSELFRGVDAVIPVPLHWTRLLSRGYNQAEIIARTLAAALGADLVTDALVRKRRTKSQAHQRMESKSSNVSGAFALRHPLPYRHVLLVDDTFTTGATLTACAAVLIPLLPEGSRISVATLAYVD